MTAFLVLGLAAVAAAGALFVRPVSTIVSGINASEATHRALAELAWMRSVLLPREREASTAPEAIEKQLEGLEPILSHEPEQQERLVRLRGLVRQRFALAELAPHGPPEPLAREMGDLLAEMERAEDARLRRAEAAARGAAWTVIASGAAGGLAVVVVVLAAVSLTGWEVARRRRTARSVAKLATRQQELEARLAYLARHDALTGLPNRRHLLEILERELRQAKERNGLLSVLVVDVNRLKHLNDLFGPEAGDDLLERLAHRLRAAVGARDTVARLGGSELAAVRVEPAATVDAIAVAEAIRDAASGSIRVGTHEFAVTSNVGIAVFPQHGADAQTLLENAERALARARSQGGNAIQVFDEGIRRSNAELFTLEKGLVGALRNGEYQVHYQPYCDLATREVGGAEALVKWKNDALGLIPAARFIPLLEDTGMIVDVGRWVLETACSQIGAWGRAQCAVPVSVNLSLVQFRDKRLLGTVAEAIRSSRVDPAHLTLEVTESVCLQDMEFAVQTLKALKDMGVSLSMDDFGTGYSSLSYLKKLPIDSIKVDISFVRDVTRDQDTASIVTAITSLARGLKLKTIAEGVETEEQRMILHLLRCDMGQGYLFSPAVPAAELEGLLAGTTPTRLLRASAGQGRRA